MGCNTSSYRDRGYALRNKSQIILANVSSTSKSATGSNKITESLAGPNLALPSTGGLQVILQTPFLRESFRKFVSKSWVPAVNAESSQQGQTPNVVKSRRNAYMASTNRMKSAILDSTKIKMQEMRDLALNSIDFWVYIISIKQEA